MSRQNLPVLVGSAGAPVGAGAYVLQEVDDAVVTLVGTGSEVSVCVEAAAALAEQGVPARVVSFPSWELFADADADTQEAVMRPELPSLAVEAGVAQGWHQWVDDVVSIDRFGASAPGGTVMRELGINVDNVVARARTLIGA
jgi:transketolase